MANNQGYLQSFCKGKRWVSVTSLFSLIFLLMFAASTFFVDWVDLCSGGSAWALALICLCLKGKGQSGVVCIAILSFGKVMDDSYGEEHRAPFSRS
ncbi:hypothetical protein RIF29_15584 [Crotalaria pallida]|uniref:Uncharacterized protein n=1 Tax=Crotalaria pallida TaxID=3830 RepID=A0AAN9ICQ6_CROPI